jgi:hypothetical protein
MVLRTLDVTPAIFSLGEALLPSAGPARSFAINNPAAIGGVLEVAAALASGECFQRGGKPVAGTATATNCTTRTVVLHRDERPIWPPIAQSQPARNQRRSSQIKPNQGKSSQFRHPGSSSPFPRAGVCRGRFRGWGGTVAGQSTCVQGDFPSSPSCSSCQNQPPPKILLILLIPSKNQR